MNGSEYIQDGLWYKNLKSITKIFQKYSNVFKSKNSLTAWETVSQTIAKKKIKNHEKSFTFNN